MAIDRKQESPPPVAPTLSAARKTVAAKRARAEAGAVLESMMGEPIAVVGMGCRFPGGADSPPAYWQLLRDGRSGIREIPEARWPGARQSLPPHLLLGGYLDTVDEFDPEFFSIAPREAASIDPQQRLLLEVSWEALLDARLPPSSLSGTETGVFVAVYNSDYFRMQMREGAELGAHTGVGAAHSVAAGRLSFLLNLHGPCLAIDTACSSSLVAAHLACQSLRRHECDIALVAGSSLKLLPDEVRIFAAWGMLSSDGRAKTFDSAADGFVPGEGCGVLVLKRLSDAIAHGDSIRAVLRGSAVNHDGRSSVLTAPNGPAQEAVMRAALRDAQVKPGDVALVETHGTGTSLGDPIEVEALDAVYGAPSSTGRANCILGAVKTNLGHLEAAAGMAGLIKLVLTLENEAIPRNLNFSRLNPQIRLRSGSRLVFANEPSPWPRGPQPRFAAVSSFGLGGTNAHVVMEEAPLLPQMEAPRVTGSEPIQCCLPISAHSFAGLQTIAGAWIGLLREPGADLGALARAASRGRDHQAFRLAVIGSTAEFVAQVLEERLASLSEVACLPVERTGKVGFVFSGQGSAWAGMLPALLSGLPAAEKTFDFCESLVQKIAGWSLREAGEDPAQFHDTAKAQPLLFAMQMALAKTLESWSVLPAAAAGHSVGEVAAAVTAGVLSLEQGMGLVLKRGRHMGTGNGAPGELRPDGFGSARHSSPGLSPDRFSPDRFTPAGRMLAVEMSFAEAEALLAEAGLNHSAVEIAAINAPWSVVFSGPSSAMEDLASVLDARQFDTRWLDVPYAFHSAAMESASHALRGALEEELAHRSRPDIALISTVTGQGWQSSDGDADYWARGIRQPVLFRQAVEQLLPLCDVIVEIGPHPVLLRSVSATAVDSAVAPRSQPVCTTVAAMRRGHSARATLMSALAALYERGAHLDWNKIYPGTLSRTGLPAYPWKRERYWLPEPATSAIAKQATTLRGLEAPGSLTTQRIDSPFVAGQLWQTVLDPATTPWLLEHGWQATPLFPFAGWLEIALQAAGAAAGGVSVVVRDFAVHRRLTLTQKPLIVQTFITPDRAMTLAAELDGAWQTFASGFWEFDEHALLADSPAFPVAEHIARATGQVDLDALYSQLAQAGLTYGPAFRLLRTVYRGEDFALAEIEPATEQQARQQAGQQGVDSKGIAPTVLDACLQTLQATMPIGAGSRAVLPLSVGRYRVVSPSPVAYALARRHTGGQEFEADLLLADSEGRLVAEIMALRVRAVPVEASPAPLWSTAWQVVEGEAAPLKPAVSAAWILARPSAPEDSHSRFLGAVGEALGRQGVAVTSVDAADLDSARRQPAAASILVAGEFETASATILRLVAREQAFPGSISRLCLLTRGALAVVAGETVDPGQAALVGLVRTLRAEYPAMAVHILDLASGNAAALEFASLSRPVSPMADLEADQAARACNSLLAGGLAGKSSEIALRNGKFLRPRFEPGMSSPNEGEESAWVIRSPGRLETLGSELWQASDPAADEVQIVPLAHGLNFRDVLTALGTYAGAAAPLGAECAGIVTRAGSHAGIAPGTMVMAFAPGSLRTAVNVRAAYVAAMPPGMSLAQAATIPVAFLTAHYAFSRLATLEPRQTVLVHSAAGGLGQAAVQLAHAAGATVLATAGSEAKRAYLRAQDVRHVFDSRSVDFAEEVLRVTEGRGVDVVLNSLSGDRIAAGFRALAPGGAFLEVGKLGIWTAEQAGAVRPDARYWAFDLGEVASRNPSLIEEMFGELMLGFAKGRLHPLPCEVFAIADAVDAFRLMASGRHVGKLVLTEPPRPILPGRWESCLRDGTTLITGGTGALGVATARWLLDQGARSIVLLSRSGSSGAARELCAEVAASAVRVEIRACDVSDREAISGVLDEIRNTIAPLSLVIHAAGEANDHLLANLDQEGLHRGMQTKVEGARLLDELTAQDSLLLTVYYSSAASHFGSAGQGSYAAANAFLDGLAEQRSARGLNTLSVNWGAWAQGGMAEKLSVSSKARLRRQGTRPMLPAAALAALKGAILSGRSRVCIADLDWRQYLEEFPQGSAAHSFFADLLRFDLGPLSASTAQLSAPGAVAGKDAEMMAAIRGAARAERTPLMEAYVRSSARRVLGLSAGRPMPGDTPLQEFGLDSLMALELRNVLAHAMNRPLSATLLFDYPTIRGLAQHLLTLLFANDAELKAARPARLPALDQITLPPAEVDLSIDLSGISDVEAEELLLAELDRKERS